MEILGRIFGSPGRVKVMRLFILNKNSVFSRGEIAKRCRIKPEAVSKELRMLSAVNFIKNISAGWTFDSRFKYGKEFENLLAGTKAFNEKIITANLKGVGKLKLLIACGFFMGGSSSNLDLLIVGDRLNKKRIYSGIRKIEAETGKELLYAVFDTKEFIYRLGVYDKLVCNVLDFPHKVILSSKELSTKTLKRA